MSCTREAALVRGLSFFGSPGGPEYPSMTARRVEVKGEPIYSEQMHVFNSRATRLAIVMVACAFSVVAFNAIFLHLGAADVQVSEQLTAPSAASHRGSFRPPTGVRKVNVLQPTITEGFTPSTSAGADENLPDSGVLLVF